MTALSIATQASAIVAFFAFFLLKVHLFPTHSDKLLTIGLLALAVFFVLIVKRYPQRKKEMQEKQALLQVELQREIEEGEQIVARMDELHEQMLKRLEDEMAHMDNDAVAGHMETSGSALALPVDEEGILLGWHYHPEEHFLTIIAWAGAGDRLLPEEAAQIREVLAAGRMADGKPVREIRVVFPNEEQAARQLAALRELGCRVFYQSATPQELVELT